MDREKETITFLSRILLDCYFLHGKASFIKRWQINCDREAQSINSRLIVDYGRSQMSKLGKPENSKILKKKPEKF